MESLLSASNDSGILFSYWTPIYGIGTIIILLLNKNIAETHTKNSTKLISLFFCSAITLSIIEATGGYLLKFIFNKELWNYSNQIFNIGKYTSLGMAFLWGIASLFIIYIIKPFIDKVVIKIPKIITYIFILLFILDLILTLTIKT